MYYSLENCKLYVNGIRKDTKLKTIKLVEGESAIMCEIDMNNKNLSWYFDG